ncbi:GntR family transcriptional regulator [Leucobacter massiliensis]|uniref:GntR family transcriptional regulator n=1 Tax=Leucobacter massiliensis TaxID=1686285 RepID=A0A2S9QSJ9_9MICO|nr:GntR family transcriptional regulator [Leucobacter massiliensis]PRI12548.1 GntR family transcriptional regulator [Leucobacter massiliensis]PRI12583.1 GntR family transcriptional regulator [Leucobacter massiliensis]
MLVRVDGASERAIYAQIADSVRADIAAGSIGPGTALSPARELAAGLGVNVHTVLRAYQQLRDEGLVELKRRRGAVVTERAAGFTELREEVSRLVERAAGLGIGPAALAALVGGGAPPVALGPTPVPVPASSDGSTPRLAAAALAGERERAA